MSQSAPGATTVKLMSTNDFFEVGFSAAVTAKFSVSPLHACTVFPVKLVTIVKTGPLLIISSSSSSVGTQALKDQPIANIMNRANIVFVRPELYYNFNSIFDKTYFDKHKMYQMRISLGVRFIIR